MSPDEIIDLMEESANDLFNVVFGISDHFLNKRLALDKWTLKEILVHLLDVELVFNYRLKRIAAEPHCKIQSFDQDLWAKNLFYSDWDYRLVTDTFRILRINTVFLLRNIRPEQWNHVGIHEERGEQTFSGIAEFLANHTRHHVEQMKKIKEM